MTRNVRRTTSAVDDGVGTRITRQGCRDFLPSAFQVAESGAQGPEDVDSDLEELAPIAGFWRKEDELGEAEGREPLDELGDRAWVAPCVKGFV